MRLNDGVDAARWVCCLQNQHTHTHTHGAAALLWSVSFWNENVPVWTRLQLIVFMDRMQLNSFGQIKQSTVILSIEACVSAASASVFSGFLHLTGKVDFSTSSLYFGGRGNSTIQKRFTFSSVGKKYICICISLHITRDSFQNVALLFCF